MEIWQDIEGYEGYYQASDKGRIKSLQRRVPRGAGTQNVKERVLKQNISTGGYLIVNLRKYGKSKTCLVSRLVYCAFKDYNNLLDIDHIDNIKTNNILVNLQQITRRLNCSKDKKNKTSVYTGVSSTKTGRWASYIKIHQRDIYLGTFSTEFDAHQAYQNKLNALNFA